jgi:hypothetical protein
MECMSEQPDVPRPVRYVLVLRDRGDPSAPARPVAVRLRQLLRVALRAFGLVCERVEEHGLDSPF